MTKAQLDRGGFQENQDYLDAMEKMEDLVLEVKKEIGESQEKVD